jgi:signal transduction histidine kinase
LRTDPASALRAAPYAVAVTAAVSGVVTAAVALLPEVRFAYEWPAAHMALSASASLIALIAAFLVFGRVQRHARLNEVVLATGLVALALADLLFVTVPALSQVMPREPSGWAALAGRSLGAALFALAAFIPRHRLRRPRLALVEATVGVAAVVVLGAFVVRALASTLPQGLSVGLPPQVSDRPDLNVPPVLLIVQFALMMLYGLAAVGFLRRSRRLDDEFFGWLALAAVLASAAHLHYFLYPSLQPQWFYTGDVFRAFFYAVLLVGSMREISSYWHALSAAAVLEERRRIARDLHDGVAQELAFLTRHLPALDGAADGDVLGRLQSAVERAQRESRRAIDALATPSGKAVEDALMEASREIAERSRVTLEFDLVPGLRLSPERTEALVRIACEAITNAAHHSGTDRVSVTLERHGPKVRMWIRDRGCGFNTSATAHGFGLTSMRDRARAVGGELRISSIPGRGSDVEAVL